jgi:hypothetical protein
MSNAGQLDLPVNVRPRRLRSLEHGWSLIHCRFRSTECIEVARRLHLPTGRVAHPLSFTLPSTNEGAPSFTFCVKGGRPLKPIDGAFRFSSFTRNYP